MGTIIIILVIVWLFFIFLAANKFSEIAAMKGHTDHQYFWWTFLFGPIGMAMVIALPDRGEKAAQEAKKAEDQLPEI